MQLTLSVSSTNLAKEISICQSCQLFVAGNFGKTGVSILQMTLGDLDIRSYGVRDLGLYHLQK